MASLSLGIMIRDLEPGLSLKIGLKFHNFKVEEVIGGGATVVASYFNLWTRITSITSACCEIVISCINDGTVEIN